MKLIVIFSCLVVACGLGAVKSPFVRSQFVGAPDEDPATSVPANAPAPLQDPLLEAAADEGPADLSVADPELGSLLTLDTGVDVVSFACSLLRDRTEVSHLMSRLLHSEPDLGLLHLAVALTLVYARQASTCRAEWHNAAVRSVYGQSATLRGVRK